MKTKLFKAYKFHFDVLFGLLMGALIFIPMALYEYYSYTNLHAKPESFFNFSGFSSVFFPTMIIIYLKDRKQYLIANSTSRKNIFFAQMLAMLTVIPMLLLSSIVVENIYYQADSYRPLVMDIFKRYFEANSVSQFNTIALTLLWIVGNYIVLFSILYFVAEIAGRLGRRGKIIFHITWWLGIVAFMIVASLIYKNNGDVIRRVFGFAGNPIHSTVTKLIIAIPFFVASYIVARRAPLKTK